MPELPEVETVRRKLARVLPGRMVVGVDVRLPKAVRNASPEQFEALVTGRTFADVRRRGKYLVLPFGEASSGKAASAAGQVEALVVHLRMTGRLTVASGDAPPDRYTRVVFALDEGMQLRFADVRTFGTIHVVGDGRHGPPGLGELGPEPLDDAFTPDVLGAALAGRRAPVKAVLLDQRRVAGLGNIYVDEALYEAAIHPRRPAGEVTDEEVVRLHESIRTVLRQAIDKGGTTVRDYVDGNGSPGGFQKYLRVYGRSGEPCGRCGVRIEKLRVAGRGTHVCPRCQS